MSSASPDDSWTLKAARDWLRERRYDGVRCPCCTQLAKVYKRPINSTQARALIVIYRNCGREWGHLPSLRMALAPHHSNEEPKLRYWGLLEEELELRPDGGRAGWWRVTPAGEAWIRGEQTVARYALVYDSRCLGLTGPQVSIRTALGTKFDYNELMGRETFWD